MSDNLWDGVANSFNTISAQSSAHRKKYYKVSKLIIKCGCKKVLDLGCGSGLLEKKLFELGFEGEITAVDASEKMLEIARYNSDEYKNRVTFSRREITDSYAINGTFDCVVLINFLYQIKNKTKMLQKIRESLATGGYLIIVEPKPKGSVLAMVKANLAGNNFSERVRKLISEFTLIFHAIRFLMVQRKLDANYGAGGVYYQNLTDLRRTIIDCSYIINKVENVQAGQNWLIVSRRG